MTVIIMTILVSYHVENNHDTNFVSMVIFSEYKVF